MGENITTVKQKFEKKLITDLDSQGDILGDSYKFDIKNIIDEDLGDLLLLNKSISAIISGVINKILNLNLKLKFNIFKFLQISDNNFNKILNNVKTKEYNSNSIDVIKLEKILEELINNNVFKTQINAIYANITSIKTKPQQKIGDKIKEINSIKEANIQEIKKNEIHIKNLDINDVNEFINILVNEYIKDINHDIKDDIKDDNIISFNYKLKLTVEKLITSTHSIEDKNILKKIIISDAKIKAVLEEKERLKILGDFQTIYPGISIDNYLINKNIENILSNNKSIFSFDDVLYKNKIEEFYSNNAVERYNSIYFDKTHTSNTKFFIIFFKKLYRVYNSSVKKIVKTNYAILYILYRIYYYYLNIVENIEKFNNKYTSNISSDYGENELKKNIDKWTYNDNKHNSKENELNVKADKVLEQVLIQYNEFFIKLTKNIIELLNSYDGNDDNFTVQYPRATEANNTQHFFREFKLHIMEKISSAESEFNKEVSLETLSDNIYKYYNITFKHELYDSIYIYKDESLDYLYKLYEYKYSEYYKKYEDYYLRFIESSELKKLFIKHKNKDKFKKEFIKIITENKNKILSELIQTNLQNVFNELDKLIDVQEGKRQDEDVKKNTSEGQKSIERLKKPMKRLIRKSSSNKVARSDMLLDIVERNLTDVFNTFKADNTKSVINLHAGNSSLLDIVEKNLIDVFNSFKPDTSKIQHKVDSSLLDIVERNLIDVFDTFKPDNTPKIQHKVDSSLLDIVERNLIDVFNTFNTRTNRIPLVETTTPPPSETSSAGTTPRNINPQSDNNTQTQLLQPIINQQIYEKITSLDNEQYTFAVYNFNVKITIRCKVDKHNKATEEMDKNISLRSFNNYIINMGNNNKFKEKFKINRKYNLIYILKIICKKYDNIIIVSKKYDIKKNILYQYKDSNYINIIFIYDKSVANTPIHKLDNFNKIIIKKDEGKENPTYLTNNVRDYTVIRDYINNIKEATATAAAAAATATAAATAAAAPPPAAVAPHQQQQQQQLAPAAQPQQQLAPAAQPQQQLAPAAKAADQKADQTAETAADQTAAAQQQQQQQQQQQAPEAKAEEKKAAAAAKAVETETNNQSNVDSLLDIVEINLKDVFDTLNEKKHSSGVAQNPTNDETNEALNLIQFLINFHDINNNENTYLLEKYYY